MILIGRLQICEPTVVDVANKLHNNKCDVIESWMT